MYQVPETSTDRRYIYSTQHEPSACDINVIMRISLPNVPSASEIDFRIENLSTQSYVNQVYIFVGDSLLFNMQ